MKNTRVCTKCKSTDVVRIDGHIGANGGGNYLRLGASIFSSVIVNRYVCCSCGFVEEWVDKNDLMQVKESKNAR